MCFLLNIQIWLKLFYSWGERMHPYSWTSDSSEFVWWPPHWHQSRISDPRYTGSPLLLHPPDHWQQWPTHPVQSLHLPIARHVGWQKEAGVRLKKPKNRRTKVNVWKSKHRLYLQSYYSYIFNMNYSSEEIYWGLLRTDFQKAPHIL